MGGLLTDRIGWRRLDDTTVVHHDDPLARVAHDCKVVGDEEIRSAGVALQLFEQIDDLTLRRHVQRRDRFIEHDELWRRGKCAGDGDALTLTTGELVRVIVEMIGSKPDLFEQLGRPLPASFTFQVLRAA